MTDDERKSWSDDERWSHLRGGRSPHGSIPPDDDRPSIVPKIAWRTAAGVAGWSLAIVAGLPVFVALCGLVITTCLMLLLM